MDQLNFITNKNYRILSINERLNKGEYICKRQIAEEFGVTEKTIQRDIDDLRAFYADKHIDESEVAIKYNRAKNSYYLVHFERDWLTNEEVLAVVKILLESRAFTKVELERLISKLITQVVPHHRKAIEEITRNEKHHYIPLKHEKPLLSPLWTLTEHINAKRIVSFKYIRQDNQHKLRKVKPVALLFSEFYFYLIAYFADDSKPFPAVFRVDRIKDICATGENFTMPYSKRFEDGEFRKRVQFMYAGALQKVYFDFSGPSLEAILDKIPTAEILSRNGNVYSLRAESYGDGLVMWLRTQGDNVQNLRVKIVE